MSRLENTERLMEIIACPKCKGDVKLKKDEKEIICHNCRLKFPVEDDIPNMLLEEAESF